MPRKKMTIDEKKAKVTIRINEILLNRLDELLKENNDKRSRLIERLLIDYVENNKNKLI